MPHSPADDQSPQSSTATQLANFARSLRDSRRSTPQTLDTILRRATTLIPDATRACITTLHKGERTIVASTDPIAEALCRHQYEFGEGPVATEVHHLDVVIAQNLETERRWPRFAADALAHGVRSLAAFQLYNSTDDLGALVLYSPTAAAFDPDSVVIGEALAAHAALALLATREDEQFRSGLANRDIIGQAKGIIMERYDFDAVQAFDILAELSQHQNSPLHRIARELVEASHPTIGDGQ